MTTLPVPPRAVPLRRRDDLDEYAMAAEAAAKATSGEFPASAPAARKPAPRKPIPMPMPSALKFPRRAERRSSRNNPLVLGLSTRGFVVMADGAAAGGLLTLRALTAAAGQLRSSRSPTALMWPASFSAAHVVMPQDSRSQTSGSSSMTSGGVRLCGSDSGPSKILTAPRRDTHLHARAGCAPLQQKQRVAHGHRPHRAWQDRETVRRCGVLSASSGRGTLLHQRVMPAFVVFSRITAMYPIMAPEPEDLP